MCAASQFIYKACLDFAAGVASSGRMQFCLFATCLACCLVFACLLAFQSGLRPHCKQPCLTKLTSCIWSWISCTCRQLGARLRRHVVTELAVIMLATYMVEAKSAKDGAT